jgi:hypothetical protein
VCDKLISKRLPRQTKSTPTLPSCRSAAAITRVDRERAAPGSCEAVLNLAEGLLAAFVACMAFQQRREPQEMLWPQWRKPGTSGGPRRM